MEIEPESNTPDSRLVTHPATKNWNDFIKNRWEHSNLRSYFTGEDLESEEADAAMQATSVINALVLTIPYGIILSLNNEFWDWMQTAILPCEEMEWKYMQINLITPLYVSLTASILALIVTVLYYFLRPKKYFTVWWKYRGKWSVAVTLLSTLISVVAILTVFATLMGWFVTATDQLCITQKVNQNRYGAAYTIIGTVSGILLLVMV